jgi:hypothetical protein
VQDGANFARDFEILLQRRRRVDQDIIAAFYFPLVHRPPWENLRITADGPTTRGYRMARVVRIFVLSTFVRLGFQKLAGCQI